MFSWLKSNKKKNQLVNGPMPIGVPVKGLSVDMPFGWFYWNMGTLCGPCDDASILELLVKGELQESSTVTLMNIPLATLFEDLLQRMNSASRIKAHFKKSGQLNQTSGGPDRTSAQQTPGVEQPSPSCEEPPSPQQPLLSERALSAEEREVEPASPLEPRKEEEEEAELSLIEESSVFNTADSADTLDITHQATSSGPKCRDGNCKEKKAKKESKEAKEWSKCQFQHSGSLPSDCSGSESDEPPKMVPTKSIKKGRRERDVENNDHGGESLDDLSKRTKSKPHDKDAKKGRGDGKDSPKKCQNKSMGVPRSPRGSAADMSSTMSMRPDAMRADKHDKIHKKEKKEHKDDAEKKHKKDKKDR